VVHTRRIAKVVKGGRRLRFNALVVVGDGQGRVGVGMGKALAIPDAVRKGTAVARRSTINIPIKGSTIPHEISVRKGASIVIIKPAPLGTGIIAAGAMRAMLELGGVQDVVGKSLGSRNPINIVQATMEALRQLRDPVTERANRLGLNAPSANGATETPAAATAPAPAAPPAAVTPPPAGAPPAAATPPPAAATPPAAPAPEATVSEPAVPAAEVPAPAAVATPEITTPVAHDPPTAPTDAAIAEAASAAAEPAGEAPPSEPPHAEAPPAEAADQQS
jgi:small subunit ribosomal protein S5